MLNLTRLLAALSSGLVLVVISPPMNLHFLHWFAFLPLLWSLREGEHKTNALLGYLSGYAGVSSLFFWLSEAIVRFSNIHPSLSLVLVHAFAAVFALPYALVFGMVQPLRRWLGVAWIFLIPALQVATEFGAPALFPYYQGVSQYRTLEVWQLASVTGVYGVSYLVMLVNCALAEAIYRQREGARPPVAELSVVAFLWMGNVAFGVTRLSMVEAQLRDMPRLRVSQLQQGVTMEERMASTPRDAMMAWVRMTSKLYGQDLDLVIWPEGATPYDPRGARVAALISNVARTVKAPIVFGGGFAEKKTDPATGREYFEQRNSIYLIGPDGVMVDRYDKMVPLPFGEYLPFADTFPILKEWIQGPGDFEAGDHAVPFEIETKSGQKVRFTTPICYEAILSRFVRTELTDASLLVNVTNDGWFGDTAAPHQHAMLSAVRAVELGLPIVRIAYTGVSMLISPTGEITEETKPFTEVIKVIETPAGHIETIYQRIGDIFAFLCTFATVLSLIVAYRRSTDVTPAPTPS